MEGLKNATFGPQAVAFAVGVLVQLFNLQNAFEVEDYWYFKSVKIWEHFLELIGRYDNELAPLEFPA